MSVYLDFILGFLLSPRDEIERVKNNNLAAPAFINLLLIVITLSLSGHLLQPYGGVKSIVLLLLNTILNVLIILSFIFIASGWYHFISSLLFGKQGEIKNTITLMSLSMSPLLLLLPSVIIILKLTGNPVLFYSLIVSLIFIWILSLTFTSVKLNYGLSARQTAVVLLSPVIFIPLFFTILTISLVIIVYVLFI